MKFLRFFVALVFLSGTTKSYEIDDFGAALSSLKPQPKELGLDKVTDSGEKYDRDYFILVDPKGKQGKAQGPIHLIIKEGTLINVGAYVIVDAANNALSPGATVSKYLYDQAKASTGITKDEWAEVLTQWKKDHGRNFAEGDALFNTHSKAIIYLDKNGNASKDKNQAKNTLHLIHAVGPSGVTSTADQKTKDTLASAYTSSLKVADEQDFKRIVFPAISTGVFGGDPKTCGEIEVNAILDYLANNKTQLEEIILLVWSGYNTDKEKQTFFDSYNDPIEKYFKIK